MFNQSLYLMSHDILRHDYLKNCFLLLINLKDSLALHISIMWENVETLCDLAIQTLHTMICWVRVLLAQQRKLKVFSYQFSHDGNYRRWIRLDTAIDKQLVKPYRTQ